MADAQQLDMKLRAILNFLNHTNSDMHDKIFPANTSSYAYIVAFLCNMASAGKVIYQRDVEREFDLSRSTVSSILKELEANGLIERRAVLSDGRLKRVLPTEGARMINEICKKDMDSVADKLFDGVDSEQIESFIDTLSKMTENAESLKYGGD